MWKLIIGVTSGNRSSVSSDIMQTDRSFDNSEKLKSLEDCQLCARQWISNYALIGCRVKYANAVSPQGEIHSIR